MGGETEYSAFSILDSTKNGKGGNQTNDTNQISTCHQLHSTIHQNENGPKNDFLRDQPNLWDKVPDTIVLVCDCALEVKMVNMIYWEAD